MAPAPDSEAVACPECDASRRVDDAMCDCGAPRPGEGWLARTGLMLSGPHPEARVGTVFSGYRIRRFVGEQGDALTYRGDPEDGTTTVDIWLFPSPEHPDTWNARVNEARAISHPNVRRVRDGGLHPDGAWLALATSTSETAADRIRNPTPAVQAIDFALQLTGALEVLLASGITLTCLSADDVHFRTAADGSMSLSIPGAAELVGARVGGGATAWTAPEARPCRAGGDHALQYTVGAFLYQALTGLRLPVDGGPPPPLNHSALEFPDALEAVVGRLLRPEPEHRYSDLGKVQTKLAALRDHLMRPEAPMGTGWNTDTGVPSVTISAESAAATRSTTNTALAVAVLAVLLSIGTLAVALAVAFRATQDTPGTVVQTQLVAEPGSVTSEPASPQPPAAPHTQAAPSAVAQPTRDAPATPRVVPTQPAVPTPEEPLTATEAPPEALPLTDDAIAEAPQTSAPPASPAPEVLQVAAARPEASSPVNFEALTGRYTGKVAGRPAVMRVKFAADGAAGGTIEITVGSQPVKRPIRGRWSLDRGVVTFEMTEVEGPKPATYRGEVPAAGGALEGATFIGGKDRGAFTLAQ